jgi:CRISPR-associated protein Cas6
MPHGDPIPVSQTIDAAFDLAGDPIPLDHGDALYAALCRLPAIGPWLAASEGVAILPVEGEEPGTGVVALTGHSRLCLRLPADDLPRVLPLAGQALTLAGRHLCLGEPRTRLLQPSGTLQARCVITRHGQDPAGFDADIAAELAELDIRGVVRRGPARVVRHGEGRAAGFALTVTGLAAEDALHLQEAGLGDERKRGCGVFVIPPGPDAV